MNRAIISLGSNTHDREEKLADGLHALREMVIEATPMYVETSQRYSNPYLNIVAVVETHLGYSELQAMFKNIEGQLGRVKGNREDAPVAIDIDIVIFNNEIMRKRDMESAYFITGLELLKKDYLNTRP